MDFCKSFVMSSIKNKFTACPICGCEEVSAVLKNCKDYLSGKRFSVARCARCNMVFTVFSSNLNIGDFYGEEYYNNKSGKFWGVFESIFQFFHRQRARNLKDKYLPSKVLDFGCGQAGMLRELSSLDVDVMGVESDAASSWLLNKQSFEVKRYSDFAGLVNKQKIEIQDLVVLWHVIEHLDSPSDTLETIKKVMDKNSLLLMSCPNFESLQAKVFRCFWFHLDVPRHLLHYSKRSVVSYLVQQGFEVENVSRGDLSQDLFGWWQSSANVFSFGCDNSVYLLLQGRLPRQPVEFFKLVAQLVSSPIWLPLGGLFYLIEVAFCRPGTVTVSARIKRV